ncbi:MAG: tetratricopeptide repeat protein [Polyangiaceae bacterium]|nr:tetratricopeptide repeat protein [Polyangiaceae bacterium]
MNATISHGERPLGVSLSSDELQALYLAGHTLFEQGSFRQAADVFRFAVLVEPLFAEAWQGLGRCHDEVGEPETAALIYETGFRLGGNDATLGYLSARALMQCGERVEARERLAELNELDLEPHVAAGVAALEQILGGAS